MLSQNDDTTMRLTLRGTRTAMSFVAEARHLAIAEPYPEAGQPGYSALADVLARAVLFADWELVGTGALVRAGSTVRVVEMGLAAPFRTDEMARRITWRLLADASHELLDTDEIEDAFGQPLPIARFIARRRANRAENRASRPMPIGRIVVPPAPGVTVLDLPAMPLLPAMPELVTGTAAPGRVMPNPPKGRVP
ncbi:MAG: hypothetical protein D6801_07810 [Alphaproteobacteria bacterium]|nr:MAG: hypothetical protein D6801_07810 [Alphaproteobacteria bacterium]